MMKPEDAAKKLSFHLIQCGALMPMDWIRENGEGSELQQAFRMALDALRDGERLRAELDEKEKYYDQMIDALAATNSTELEQVKRDFDGLCEYIDSEGFLRKQFCENGNPDLEPCICPSLQEHPGYIDSDDCEGCDHFCNSWCGQRED